MGVAITGSRTLLIRIGATASSEAQVHTSTMSGDQGNQGKLGIPLFRGSCIPFLSVFRILTESAETWTRCLDPIVYDRLKR